MEMTLIKANLRWYQLLTREIKELRQINKIRPISNAIVGLKAEANCIYANLEKEIPSDLLTQLPIITNHE
ncbi:MAG: hypothetical protein L6Q78_11135 [Bacteroidia bacterium]|nr:hypothetical protein [Bacteroidia bacterium]